MLTNHGKNGERLDLVNTPSLESFAADLHNINWVVVSLRAQKVQSGSDLVM